MPSPERPALRGSGRGAWGLGACRSFGAACYAHVCDRSAVRGCAAIALVVGTILTLVNQAERLDDLPSSPVVAIRVGLNYLIPFIVSSLGYISARRRRGPASARPDAEG